MEPIFTHCAGLDVHKKFLIACVRIIDAQGRLHQQIRRFSTMTQDLERLRDWLTELGVTHVALESTGVFWQPVFNVLESQLTVWVVNAQHVKYVPGRKTDVKDAEWLAQLLQQGLLRPSSIPPRQQRALRELTRYRRTVVEDRTRIVNRIQKVLEDANIKLTVVASDIRGVSAQLILRALLSGEQDAARLAELARGRLRAKRADLEQALVGRLQDYHRIVLTELLEHLDFLDAKLQRLEEQLETMVAQVPEIAHAVDLLDTIPGVNRQLAILIVAETGVDLSRFPSDKHLSAWAGMAPGNNETGGKQRAAPTRKGNRVLRWALVQAAHGAAHKTGSYLKSLYYRLASRRGKQRAAVAVGRTILQIAYHLLRRDTTYVDLGADYFDHLDRSRTTKRLVQRLEHLGFEVNLAERPLPAAA